MGAIKGERDKNPDFGKEFYQVDETTDFEYGVEDWLLDYLDELGAGGLHEKRCQVCDTIIGLFAWKEQSPADFMFEKSSALSAMGRADEAVALCEKWYQDEPESQLSAAALIYARINAEDYAELRLLLEAHVRTMEEGRKPSSLAVLTCQHICWNLLLQDSSVYRR